MDFLKAASPRIIFGALAWVLTAQYFIVEAIVQRAWGPPPYSMRHNLISDLGVTVCGNFPPGTAVYVCSALHPLMNASFIVNALLTILGVVLLRRIFPKTKLISAGLALIALGSLALAGVGLFPENERPVIHLASAGLFLLLVNAGLLSLGIGMLRERQWPRLAFYTLALGIVALSATILIPLGLHPAIGIGLMERIAAYPLTIWTITMGIFLLLRLRQV